MDAKVPESPVAKAEVIFSPEESISISETITEDTIKDITQEEVTEEYVKVKHSKKQATIITEVETTPIVEEFEETKPKKKSAKPSVEDKPKEKCKVSKPVVQVKEIEDVLKPLHVEEFGPGEQPMKELATVGVLLRKGVSVDEVRIRFVILSGDERVKFHWLRFFLLLLLWIRCARSTIRKNFRHYGQHRLKQLWCS